MKNVKELATDYLNAFSQKDKQKLSELYSDDFSLRDWLSEAKGKEKVLELNQQFFDNYPDFSLSINEIYVDENTACCEITINLGDGSKDLLVVDVINFSQDGRLEKLKADFGSA